MNYVSSFLSEDWVYALGWTVLHALWQGGVMALLLAACLLLLQRRSALLRYRLSLAALFSLPAISVLTFLRVLPKKADAMALRPGMAGQERLVLGQGGPVAPPEPLLWESWAVFF